MLFIITDLTYDCNFRLQSLLEKCLFLVQLQRCNFDFLDPIQDFYKIQFSNCQSNNYIKHFHIFFLASHQDTFLLHQITTRLLLYTANHWYMQAAMVANVQVVKVFYKQVPWWWSECSPSTSTIRVRIPLNSTIFLYNLYLIGTKINKKEARDGPFLKRCITISNLALPTRKEFNFEFEIFDFEKQFKNIFFLFQNLKDQILTTNVWLEHVSNFFGQTTASFSFILTSRSFPKLPNSNII